MTAPAAIAVPLCSWCGLAPARGPKVYGSDTCYACATAGAKGRALAYQDRLRRAAAVKEA